LPLSGEPDPAVVADDEIRRNVERALLDLDPQKNADIRVLVSQGVVFLTGTVPTWDGNNDRLHAARSVPGVRSILSELVVAGEDPAR
jgi:osmotically-inducible protein OsmY